MDIRTRQEVADLFGVSTRTLHNWVTDPQFGFPRPIAGPGKSVWDAKKIEEWIAQGGAVRTGRDRPRKR
jgi:predicted DNA-binding transcriptional regulator AlpA